MCPLSERTIPQCGVQVKSLSIRFVCFDGLITCCKRKSDLNTSTFNITPIVRAPINATVPGFWKMLNSGIKNKRAFALINQTLRALINDPIILIPSEC